MSLLAKLTSKHGEYLHDPLEDIDVFHVRSPHLLTQAAGYLKYSHGQKNSVGIYYRGQSKLYRGSLAPAIYRNPSGDTCKMGVAKRRIGELKSYLEACKKQGRVLKQVPEYAWEPLLQHYGIYTRWLDIVDNVWIALWFACNQAKGVGKSGEFVHFERRKPTAKSEYAYITMIKAGLVSDDSKPGL